MALLRGYTSVPGSARRVKTPGGQIISRRQYENIKAQRYGWSSWSDYQRVRTDPAHPDYQVYHRFLKEAQTRLPNPYGHGAMSSRFAFMFNRARKDRFGKRRGRMVRNRDEIGGLYEEGEEGYGLHHSVKGPDQPMAQFLVYLRMRNRGDWWNVGDTQRRQP